MEAITQLDLNTSSAYRSPRSSTRASGSRIAAATKGTLTVIFPTTTDEKCVITASSSSSVRHVLSPNMQATSTWENHGGRFMSAVETSVRPLSLRRCQHCSLPTRKNGGKEYRYVEIHEKAYSVPKEHSE